MKAEDGGAVAQIEFRLWSDFSAPPASGPAVHKTTDAYDVSVGIERRIASISHRAMRCWLIAICESAFFVPLSRNIFPHRRLPWLARADEGFEKFWGRASNALDQ
jgi:hypothetical protein